MSSIGKVQRYKLRNQQVIDPYISTETEDTGNSVYIQILKIFHELGVKGKIDEESKLEEDLGIDSLNLFELCVEIQKQFGIDITNWISSQLTVKELCEMVEKNGESAVDTVSYDVEQYPMKRRRCDKWVLSLFCFLTRVFYKFEVSGIENIPENGPYIICANHQSHLDGMWIISAGKKKISLDNFCCMAKQEHLDSGISRRGLRITGGIPVSRGANTSPALKRVLECLKDGKVVLIHPEGTRTSDGNLGEFKLGVERIALEADVPVLPVKIEGAYEIYPKNQRLPHLLRKGGKYSLKVKFFKPEKGKSMSYIRKILS